MAEQGRKMRTQNTVSDSETSAMRNQNRQSEQDEPEVVAVQPQIFTTNRAIAGSAYSGI